MYSIFVIFQGSVAYDSWMRTYFHSKFVCTWFSCEHVFNMCIANLVGLLWIGAVHTIFEVAPKVRIAGLFLVNIAARTTRTQSAMEIDWTGCDYQTLHVWHRKRHSLYVGVHHHAAKMLCQHALLPEWPEWPHFAVAVVTAGLLWWPPKRSV